MANYITNDFGQQVPAVGAPGSIARMKVQHPQFIQHLWSLWFQSQNDSEFMGWAFDSITREFSGLDRDSMIEIAKQITEGKR